MWMTTLFNLFCPFLSLFSLENSVIVMCFATMGPLMMLMSSLIKIHIQKVLQNLSMLLFPLGGLMLIYLTSGFLMLGLFNLVSLMVFSYPVTTTLSFNLSMALSLWFISMLVLSTKRNFISSLLPSNSPWYLIPFLSVVELISILVRPVTLCFRLLANMSAGHILLSLICKLPYFTWMLGSLFGLLELLISLVQSFVFLMLVSVYLEEAISHLVYSLWNMTLKKLKFMMMMYLSAFMFGCVICVIMNIMWKWNKALLLLILLEALTALVLAMLISFSSMTYIFIPLMFSFFVSEALILLSSFYAVLRSSGVLYSSLLFIYTLSLIKTMGFMLLWW